MARRSTYVPELACGILMGCSVRNSISLRTATCRVATSLLVLAFAIAAAVPAYAASDRIALVLGAQEYTALNKSAIAVKQAENIASALAGQGFDVTTVKNPTDAVARASLREFANKAQAAQVALVIVTGHGVTFDGRTYFIPVNTEITRPTDLLSRALAVPSIAQIAGRARTGAVFFLMTVAELPSTMQGLASRPSGAEPDANVVVVYSTSDKIPVSSVDRASEQAARDFATAATERQLRLSTLITAAMAGGVGKTVGSVTDLSLLPPPPTAQPKDTSAQLSQAEQRAREAEARAQRAEESARAEARKAEAAIKAEAATKAEAASKATPPAPAAEAAPPPQAAKPAEDAQALELVEQMFGPPQRKQIQVKLKRLGFYKGPIDALFLDLTRQAIKDYQDSLKQPATGYLTPNQVRFLLQTSSD